MQISREHNILQGKGKADEARAVKLYICTFKTEKAVRQTSVELNKKDPSWVYHEISKQVHILQQWMFESDI